MLFVALAVVAVALLQLLPWAHVRQVEAVWPGPVLSPASLRRLAERPWADRLSSATQQLQEGSWAQQLCIELRSAEDDGQRLWLVNEALTGVEHRLSQRQHWPRTANRLTLLVGALLLVAGLVAGARLELLWLVLIVLAGLMSGATASRLSRGAAQRHRLAVDAFVGALVGQLEARDDGTAVVRRSWRYRRRRAP